MTVPPSTRFETCFHIHMVSDSTGETLMEVMRASVAQFEGTHPLEHLYALVRSSRQMERVFEEVEAYPGVVMYTIVNADLRRDEPYSSYEEFDFEVAVGGTGDVFDRYQVRMEELIQSCRIIKQAVDDLPQGAYAATDSAIRRPFKPEIGAQPAAMIHHFKLWMEGHGLQPPAAAECYLPTESPNGELGFYIVTDGSDRPYRLRLRAPSFLNYQLFQHMAAGMDLSEALVVLGSLNVVAGEVDR